MMWQCSRQAKAAFSQEKQLRFAFWTGLPVADLCDEASRVEPGTVIILYLSQVRDRDGRVLATPREVVAAHFRMCTRAGICDVRHLDGNGYSGRKPGPGGVTGSAGGYDRGTRDARRASIRHPHIGNRDEPTGVRLAATAPLGNTRTRLAGGLTRDVSGTYRVGTALGIHHRCCHSPWTAIAADWDSAGESAEAVARGTCPGGPIAV